MDDLCDMTLDKFKLWSVNALKVYLSRRNKSVNGNFEELSARAFCAWEENIPVDGNAEQNELRLLQEYKVKLKVDSDVIPDPFSLTSGWKGEKTGMEMWPSVYITDIASYLNCNTPGEVVNRVLNEYKEGKAYRYFDCGWVKEVFIHDIRGNSDKCILKTKVTPSQSVNNKNYDVWVLVKKKSDSKVGGEILTGYCSCTAGMLGTCNHIAGLLFRIEHAVKTGLTSPTCTDKPCQWNVPKNKTSVKPVKVSSVSWKKSNYLQRKEVNLEENLARSQFTPLSKVQCDEVKNHESMRQKLYDIMKDEVPNSVFVLAKEKRRPLGSETHSNELPPSLISDAQKISEMDLQQEEKEEALLKTLQLTPQEIENVNQATITQSASVVWRQHRKGRITASNFQRVNSRVNTLKKDQSADPSKLVSTVMGHRESIQTLAMKHGLSMEPFAKRAYSHIMRKKHKKFSSSDSGLTIDQDAQCIAASADLEIECDCCGKGLCEIKCPETIKGSIPSDENVPYLKRVGDEYELSKSHPYFYQIQGQMGVLRRQYCDLFVYTVHGSITVRVKYEARFWEELRQNLLWFWKSYVVKELVKAESIENNSKSPTPMTPRDNVYKTPIIKQCPPLNSGVSPKINISKVRRALNPITPNQAKGRKIRKTKANKKQPVYLCGTCGLDCVDNPKSDSDQSVNCDLCNVWVHYICAGVDDTVSDMDEWVCPKCE